MLLTGAAEAVKTNSGKFVSLLDTFQFGWDLGAGLTELVDFNYSLLSLFGLLGLLLESQRECLHGLDLEVYLSRIRRTLELGLLKLFYLLESLLI